MEETEDNNPENIFKILLATDNHLGYGERNTVRENDTFVTFEEILQIAVKEEVDFILLGGDLFHETKPSSYCYAKCSELIRKYCMGDKPVEFEFLSDPSYNFPYSANPMVNYEDPNINISIPIFSIHGNHDDPTGRKQMSAMNMLAINGLINYFGRWDSVTQVEINPILLQKGETQLALYGLSHIRDERLARLFLDRKVIMKTPENVHEWFNILVLHQNRANRGVKNFIAESFIPEFINLVMWGHEHDCKITPTQIASSDTFITQPGSSVATSLAEGEAIPKKVGLLRINGMRFHIEEIELKTVRPFIYKQMVLDPPEGHEFKVTHTEIAEQKVKVVLEEMINEAKMLGRRNDLIPLIRLIVKYSDERQVFNAIRFGQRFTDKVANPEDMIKFSSLVKKTRQKRTGLINGEEEDDEIDEVVARVEDLLPKYFTEDNKLSVLSVNGLSEAVKKFVDANDNEALADIINYQEKKTLEKLNELAPEENDVIQCLENLRAARKTETDEFIRILNDPNRPKAKKVQNDDIVTINDSDDDDSVTSTPKPAKGPGSRGGRGSRGARASRGSRGGKASK